MIKRKTIITAAALLAVMLFSGCGAGASSKPAAPQNAQMNGFLFLWEAAHGVFLYEVEVTAAGESYTSLTSQNAYNMRYCEGGTVYSLRVRSISGDRKTYSEWTDAVEFAPWWRGLSMPREIGLPQQAVES